MSGAKRRIFFVVPLQFLVLQVQLFVLVSTFVMVSTVWTLSCFWFFYSRCLCAQSFIKVGARVPVPYGVGATFVGQFHTKNIIKQSFNLNAQCHQDFFDSVCVQSYAQVILLTRFYKLLTRVAILSWGGARASSASMARRLWL